MLVVTTGLPGTGKSTIAQAVADSLAATYLSVDFFFAILEAKLACDDNGLTGLAYQLVRGAAELQCGFGRVAVIDAGTPTAESRDHFRQLAADHGVGFVLLATVCSDIGVHRQRVEERRQAGDGVTWEEVERRARRYEPPERPDARLDACAPLSANIAAALVACRATTP